MKKLFALLGVALLALGASSAKAAVTFEADHAFQVFSDSRWEGSNRHFGFNFDLGEDIEMGYFFEEALWDWRADVGQASPNTIQGSAHLNGLRAIKYFGKYLGAGIDIGTAQIQVNDAGGTTATSAAAAPLQQTKPFMDVLGRVQYPFSNGRGITSGVRFDLGYRFLDINDVTAAGAIGAVGERTLDDLNAVLLRDRKSVV